MKSLSKDVLEIKEYVNEKTMLLLKELHEKFSEEEYDLAVELFSSNFIVNNILCWFKRAKYDPSNIDHAAEIAEIVLGACKISIDMGLSLGKAIVENKQNIH